MKKYRFLLLLLVSFFLYVGCEENDIDLYNETPRLNFYYSNMDVYFVDTDYVKGHTEKEWMLRVNLQGDRLPEARNFCLKVQPNETYSLKANISFDEKYVFPMDSIYQIVTIKVHRPEALTVTSAYQADIYFDLDNPLHQFDPGREDREYLSMNVYYRIKRNDWNEWYWGKYADSKYFFMMDYFGATHDGIPTTQEAQKNLYDAYEEYKKSSPPLLDENGEEIVFKQVN